MLTSDLDRAAMLIFRLCHNHPELCPHEMEWSHDYTKDGVKHVCFKCRICGYEHWEEKDLKL